MRSLRFAGSLAILLIASSAFASPLFGTWKTQWNGQPVTVVLSYVDRQLVGKMIVGSGAGARELPIQNAHIMDRPPSTLRFEVANPQQRLAATGDKLVFELHSVDSDNATLRVVDATAQGAPVKAVKQR